MRTHGRIGTYDDGCRCADCTEAARVAHKKGRERAHRRFANGEIDPSTITHGNVGYTYFGCRCAICRKYSADQSRPRRDGRRRRQDALRAAPNKHKHWSGPEMEVAMRADLTANEAADILGRTRGAVRAMRVRCRKNPRDDILWGQGPGLGVKYN